MHKVSSILMIDDSESDQFLTQIELEEWDGDIQLFSARDGKEGIELLDTLRPSSLPDLILLDINMPVMNGLEFLEAYERKNISAPPPVIVMLTSSDQERDKSQASLYSCVKDYMLKPLTQEKISSLVTAYESWVSTEGSDGQ